MTALWFVLVLALVFAAVWMYFGRNPQPRAKIGPDGTNVRDPESFVVHHEGKGQGLDIANTALKKRTEELRRDLPGDADKLKAPVPGRDMVRMDAPPSDVSKFGDVKVAPGAEPKEKVLMEGPPGSRPETPEEPGSPYAKGRRVTDNHRDVELAADLLPEVYPGRSHYRDRGRVLPFRSRTSDAAAPADFHTVWGEDQTVALVRNPRSLYVYWERAGHGDENLSAIVTEAEWKKAEPCLRVYDLTSGARPGHTVGHTFDLVVSELDDHYFINSGIEPGREYVVAYGRLLADGQFYPISQSEPVATPPESPAPESEASMLYKLYGYKAGSSAQHFSSPR